MPRPFRRLTPVALLAIPSLLAAQPRADLTPLLDSARASADLPAMVAMVVSGDAVLAEGVAGVRAIGSDVPATLDDRWHIGSITKSFTSTLAAKLVADGAFSWDLTLGDVLAEGYGTAFEDVTAAQLAQHTAGLPANPPLPWFVSARASRRSLPDQRRVVLQEILRREPLHPAGSKMLYSNVGYLALGAMLEARLGTPWQALLREHVLTPLELNSAGFGAPDTPGALDQPRGHVNRGTGRLMPRPGFDNPAALGPAGTLHMSVRDLARYAQAHLRGERGEDGLLTAEAFRALHRGGLGDYGYGWVDARHSTGQRMIWHNGSNTAWYALVALFPETDRAIVVISNGPIVARPVVHGVLDALVDRWAVRP